MRILFLALALVLGTRLDAQATLKADARLFATPGARPLATLRQGTTVQAGTVVARYTQVTVDGYVAADALGAARDSFEVTVRPAGGTVLRAAADAQGRVVAELRTGMGLAPAAREGAWVRVRRTGWVETRLVVPAPAVARAPTAAAPATPAARQQPGDTTRVDSAQRPAASNSAPAARADEPPRDGELTPASAIELRDAPHGSALGEIRPGARITALARDREWVRVRLEGWVRERDVIPADSTMRQSPSAADLRADPEGSRGRVVRWDVQVLALRTGDPFRKGLVRDEPYLLARGPADENALLYLAIPPSLLATARAIPALTAVTITARVRTGRSEPVGVPILDLQSIARR